MGHALRDLGRPVDAAAVYQQAIEIREKLLARRPFPYYRSELARAYGSLGQAKSLAGQNDGALEAYQLANQTREKLVEANPLVPDYRSELALSYKNLADERKQRGDFDEAFRHAEKAVQHFEQLAENYPQNADYYHSLAVARAAFAYFYRRHKNQPDKALKLLNQSQLALTELIKKNVATSKHRFSLAQIHEQIALLHQQTQDYQAALRTFPRSNGLLEELAAAGTGTPDYKHQLARNYINMSFCYQQSGQFEEALHAILNTLVIREQLVAEYPQVPEFREMLAKTHEDITVAATAVLGNAPAGKDPAEQLALQQERHAEWEAWASDHTDVAALRFLLMGCKLQIGKLYGILGRPVELQQSYEQARDIGEKLVRDHDEVAIYRYYLAIAHRRLGVHFQGDQKFAAALTHLERAHELQEQVVQNQPDRHSFRSDLGWICESRGQVLAALGRLDEAETAYARAIECQRQALAEAPGQPAYRYCLNFHYENLAGLYRQQRRIEEAVATTLERTKMVPDEGELWYQIAVDLARCVILVGQDPARQPTAEQPATVEERLTAEEKELRQTYIDHTLATLLRAQAKGFHDSRAVEQQPAFEPLREHERFRRYLLELGTE